MTDDAYISTEQLAEVANISVRKARAALSAIAQGTRREWRGAALKVKTVKGRGGNSGLSYQVRVSSLPTALQEAVKPSPNPVQLALPFPRDGADKQGREHDWWHFRLSSILAHPKGSTARGAAVRALVGKIELDWNSRPVTLSRSTIMHKVAQLEAGQSAGRKGRADAGKAKVIISRLWDSATAGRIAEDDRGKIAHNTLRELRGTIKAGATQSRSLQHVRAFLMLQTRAHGVLPNDPAELERVCAIPPTLYWREKPVFHRVYQHKHDRKASSDALPHIRRRMADTPAAVYVLDVHHINVLVKQGDKVGTVKMLGLLDMGTRRFTAEFIFFELSGGVRNIDNIEMLRRVFADPAWGVPELIYVDNGKEYAFARYLDDALKAGARAAGNYHERASHIIKSLPFNAQAKAIENVHHQLNNHEIRHLQGFIDDDRFDPMRPALGKLPKPFEGGFDAFVARMRGLLEAYNWTPQPHGELRGDSPMSRFRSHVEKGWGAIVMDSTNFDAIFSEPHSREVRNHSVQVGGRTWTCPELDGYLGSKVVVRIPVYHGFNELRLEDTKGAFLGIARPDRQFDYIDPRGAQTSAARKKATRAAIAAASRSVPDVDMEQSRIAFGQAQMPIAANEASGRVAFDLAGGTPAAAVIPRYAAPQTRAERDAERAEMLALRQKHAPKQKAV